MGQWLTGGDAAAAVEVAVARVQHDVVAVALPPAEEVDLLRRDEHAHVVLTAEPQLLNGDEPDATRAVRETGSRETRMLERLVLDTGVRDRR